MVFLKNLLHRIYDFTGHGVHNIIISNIVSYNVQCPFRVQDITLFVGIYVDTYLSKVKSISLEFDNCNITFYIVPYSLLVF